ncbi:MAG: hypothetical protein QOD47_2698 [Gemmatimonadaceae bacterium]|jgi:hypothetical protein|nr:hypothetical protein [Gemmatimonadaceae bacterium]
MNAPFGQTGTGTPFIRKAASPVPTLPKIKLESLAVSSCSGFGYTTFIWTGPRTAGTGGSFAFAVGSGAGTSGGAGSGGIAGRAGAVAQDAATITRQQAKTLMTEAFIVRI